MAFEIVVVAEVRYEKGSETLDIPRNSIKGCETTLVSEPAFKDDVTTYSTVFKASTVHGPFEWNVVYYVGVEGYGVESVSLLTHPIGVSEVEDLRVQTVESQEGDVFEDVEEY